MATAAPTESARFLAINNGVWHDSTLTLELNSAWGLPDGQRWDVYRWWPEPAKLGDEHGSQATLALRPFDIVLLEVVPAGEPPTLNRQFEPQAMPVEFRRAEPGAADHRRQTGRIEGRRPGRVDSA